MNNFEELKQLCIHTASQENVLLLQKQLVQLSYELDCVGLPSINIKVDVLEQLIGSMHNLIKLYRKSIALQKDLSLEKNLTSKENEIHKKEKDTSQEKLNILQFDLKLQHEIVRRKNREIETLKSDYAKTTKDLEQQRGLHKSKITELLHKINRLKIENQDLRVKFKDEIGKYKNKDIAVADIISKYKAKETIYQETITNLQENSQQLLSEIVNLREEIAIFFNPNTECA